jgi:type 1 glutamine amidotransferase
MILRAGAAALGLTLTGCDTMASAKSTKRSVLVFTKSSGFEHSVIQQKNGPSFAENVLSKTGPDHGIDFQFSKDGGIFTSDQIGKFDAFVFYTTGDLTQSGTDKMPPMPAGGKELLLQAIHNGKGFVGIHSATDTFHTPEPDGLDHYQNDGPQTDPYIQMIGAEFIIHGKQQKSTMRSVDPRFPGAPSKDFELTEEWYSFKNIANDLHVILAQDTAGMEGHPYQRPSYPATWARQHGRGRVFHTSLGHREDVWTNPLFQEILFGGIAWATGTVNADIRPNIDKATPGYSQLPPK